MIDKDLIRTLVKTTVSETIQKSVDDRLEKIAPKNNEEPTPDTEE